MSRIGKPALDIFMSSVASRDWSRIDRELYALMTEDERDELGKEVLSAAREAVDEQFRHREGFQNALLNVVMSIALSFV